MSMLAALNSAYERLSREDKVPTFGYSSEKVSYVLSLNADGTLACPPIDIRVLSGKKPVPKQVQVPAPPKRTVGILSCFLWDKSSYVLGVTAGEGKRTAKEHQEFVDYHLRLIGNEQQDEGLKAFVLFLQSWDPASFEALDWPDEVKSGILDQNIIFALEKDRHAQGYLHDRAIARKIWAETNSGSSGSEKACLVTGHKGSIARLHPSIKGVWGGQSSGGSIVSFNQESFESYGHSQGENAPVSQQAAFGYTAVLNKFLEKGSPNRIQIGDASVVFWADASDVVQANEAEFIFGSLFGYDEEAEAKNIIRPMLEKIRNGQPLHSIRPNLSEGVRFYVLGLAPNAARISIRFWFEDSFGSLMDRYQRFLSDMQIAPPDRDDGIALWKYLCETAVQGKTENVAPNLAGDWMRSILSGTSYPATLLAAVLMRIRADHVINARRVSILKAVLIRNLKMKEVPVAFDPENTNKGYLLGRLFALYEQVQRAALGEHVNATVKDKFYGSASAQPRKVFHLLESGSAYHLSKLGKQKPGYKVTLEKKIGEIMALMSPADDPFPAALAADQQALFGLGYYHQRNEFFKPQSTTTQEGNEA